MEISEATIRDALGYIERFDVSQLPPGTSTKKLRRRDKARRIVVEETTKLLAEGYRGPELRRRLRSALRSRIKFDPTIWLIIIRLVIELLPLLVEWWRSRTKEGWETGHA